MFQEFELGSYSLISVIEQINKKCFSYFTKNSDKIVNAITCREETIAMTIFVNAMSILLLIIVGNKGNH